MGDLDAVCARCGGEEFVVSRGGGDDQSIAKDVRGRRIAATDDSHARVFFEGPINGIVSGAGVDVVGAAAAVDDVVVFVAVDFIGDGPAHNGIVALVAVDDGFADAAVGNDVIVNAAID